MAKFNYRAVMQDGARVTGVIEGSDRSAVLRRLSEQQMHPIEVSAAEVAPAPGSAMRLGGKPAGARDIMVFTRELAWLLRAGMSLSNALDVLAKEAPNQAFGALVNGLQADIRKGQSFHDALAATNAFTQHYVSMVEVGEATGKLSSVLERICGSMEREQKLRGRLVSALIYPSLLVALAFGAVIFIMVAVVPGIKDMIAGSGAPIPDSAQFVIGMSDWLIANGMTALIAIPSGALLLALVLGATGGRALFAGLAARLPFIGALFRKSAVVRFCNVLDTLLASGVTLSDSLRLMRPAAGNRHIAETLGEMEAMLRRGEDYLVPLERSAFFPRILPRMLRVGRETGNLSPSLQQVTAILEDELDRTIERLLTLLEPAIILALSGVIAYIITSLMGAIISINDLAL